MVLFAPAWLFTVMKLVWFEQEHSVSRLVGRQAGRQATPTGLNYLSAIRAKKKDLKLNIYLHRPANARGLGGSLFPPHFQISTYTGRIDTVRVGGLRDRPIDQSHTLLQRVHALVVELSIVGLVVGDSGARSSSEWGSSGRTPQAAMTTGGR